MSALRVYTTSWCGPCRRLKDQLGREGVPFTVVDIEADPDAEALVRSVNGGNATVPTVEFPDGSTLTNPTLPQVLDRLGTTA